MQWNIDEEDARTIGLIIERASVIIEQLKMPEYETLDMSMDITAVHLNDGELDLDQFLTFKEPDFMHDIYGIRRHINRATGKLMEGFAPRCSK